MCDNMQIDWSYNPWINIRPNRKRKINEVSGISTPELKRHKSHTTYQPCLVYACAVHDDDESICQIYDCSGDARQIQHITCSR